MLQESQFIKSNLTIQLGDAMNFHGTKGIPVKVTKFTGPLSYKVEANAGIIMHCHVDPDNG